MRCLAYIFLNQNGLGMKKKSHYEGQAKQMRLWHFCKLKNKRKFQGFSVEIYKKKRLSLNSGEETQGPRHSISLRWHYRLGARALFSLLRERCQKGELRCADTAWRKKTFQSKNMPLYYIPLVIVFFLSREMVELVIWLFFYPIEIST